MRKTLSHNLLVSELYNQLKFPVKVSVPERVQNTRKACSVLNTSVLCPASRDHLLQKPTCVYTECRKSGKWRQQGLHPHVLYHRPRNKGSLKLPPCLGGARAPAPGAVSGGLAIEMTPWDSEEALRAASASSTDGLQSSFCVGDTPSFLCRRKSTPKPVRACLLLGWRSCPWPFVEP